MEYMINFPKAHLSGRVYINRKHKKKLQKAFDTNSNGFYEFESLLDLVMVIRGEE